MKNLIQLLNAWLPRFQTQQERDEAYIAAAVNLYDLESRIRKVDAARRGKAAPWQLSHLG